MIKKHINAVATIAFRDLIKFLRDRRRFVATLIFPLIFVGVLGSSLEANIGGSVDFNFLTFTFTGVFIQVIFQSTASGIISLIEDKENDFAQELFIAPIPRYLILVGKVIGESMVSLFQGVAVFIFGLILGVPMTAAQAVALIPIAILAALFGGSFGVVVMSNLEDQRTANQIFPFILFPQIFLSGVFSPINQLPPILLVLSRLMPLTYIVDLGRNLFYLGSPERELVIIHSTEFNIAILILLFVAFISIGTFVFTRNSRNL
jgi:ABC-2 type transport system permease protein